ncbi:nickel/cobalt transporter [Streptomyces sp. NPDC055808]
MNPILRRTAIGTATAALASAVLLSPASAAPAHPLGNFTVNYHTGLTLHTDHVGATVIVDRAEISTLQERSRIDLDHDGNTSLDELRTYSRRACSLLGGQLQADVNGHPLPWSPVAQDLAYQPGQAGLDTSRLTCTYTAPADLTQAADLTIRTTYDTQRIGWREMTARGQGVRISGSELPATSPTDELRRYPPDPTASPLNQHTARLHAEPGDSLIAGPDAGTSAAITPRSGWVPGFVEAITTRFDALIGARELTVPVGLLALLLAVVLGASHAVLPGHGKTIMAAYLAGRRGTRRDAVAVGATVTLTHTAGVLVLGLALPTATHLAGETVLTWLGAASGLIVTGIGLWLLISHLRGRPTHAHHHHHGHHHHGHSHHHDHDGGHEHHDAQQAHAHDHDHAPSGLHLRLPQRRRPTPAADAHPGTVATLTKPETHALSGTPRQHAPHHAHGKGGLIGMGIAGGLVPSPSALVVLLGAVALGRTTFGVLLVIAYGLGMAATLTAAGLLLVRIRDRLEARSDTLSPRAQWALSRLATIGPAMTALLVVVVGLGLTLTAVTSTA